MSQIFGQFGLLTNRTNQPAAAPAVNPIQQQLQALQQQNEALKKQLAALQKPATTPASTPATTPANTPPEEDDLLAPASISTPSDTAPAATTPAVKPATTPTATPTAPVVSTPNFGTGGFQLQSFPGFSTLSTLTGQPAQISNQFFTQSANTPGATGGSPAPVNGGNLPGVLGTFNPATGTTSGVSAINQLISMNGLSLINSGGTLGFNLGGGSGIISQLTSGLDQLILNDQLRRQGLLLA
ncbi:MAG: hypothetical protein AB7P76_06635 [Candidatus Melainabacteria bacterium]